MSMNHTEMDVIITNDIFLISDCSRIFTPRVSPLIFGICMDIKQGLTFLTRFKLIKTTDADFMLLTERYNGFVA